MTQYLVEECAMLALDFAEAKERDEASQSAERHERLTEMARRQVRR